MADRVLITGATGLIGRALLARWPAGLEAILSGHQQVDLLAADASDQLVARTRPDVVLHLAWCASGTPGYRTSDLNLAWQRASLELRGACRRHGATFYGVGTVVDAGGGSDAYSRSKEALRHTLHDEIQDGTIGWLRPFYVFAPDGRRPAVVAEARAAVDERRDAVLQAPDARHDFVHVDDVARGIATALVSGLRGAVDIGSGRARTVTDLVERLGATWTSSPVSPPAHGPEVRHHEDRVADVAPLRARGWAPTTTEEFFDHA